MRSGPIGFGESISSNGSPDIVKSLKISFGSSFVSLRAFGSKFWQFRFPVYTFQTEKTALDYLYPFLNFSVHNFCARTDGQTFFEKVLFFPPDQEYIYIYLYFWPKLVYLFSILQIGMKKATGTELFSRCVKVSPHLMRNFRRDSDTNEHVTSVRRDITQKC